MKHLILLLTLFTMLLAGCLTFHPRAVVTGRMIQNPKLGLSGFAYTMPAGVVLHNPEDIEAPLRYDMVQAAAKRIYDMGEFHHPQGGETFYESFLMLSDPVAFILVTIQYDRAPSFDYLSSWTDIAPRWQVLPLFNVTESRQVTMGERRLKAFIAKGSAFESKGWYYAKEKPDRLKFKFEACKVLGTDGCSYLLMGFSLPENQDKLSSKMQEMMSGFQL